MRILIISTAPAAVGARQIAEAALRLGHESVILTPEDSCKLDGAVDVIIPRVSPANYQRLIKTLGIISGRFPAAVWSVTPDGIVNSFDKFLSYKALRKGLVRTPETRMPEDVLELRELSSKLPLVAKPRIGNRGRGISLVRQSAELDVYEPKLGTYIFQKFLPNSQPEDVRAFVIGGEVVAAMRRTAKSGEFITNMSQGAVAELVSLSQKDCELAVKASDVFGAEVAGVDLMKDGDEYTVLEVNVSPGLKIMDVVRQPLTDMWVSHMIKLVGIASQRSLR